MTRSVMQQKQEFWSAQLGKTVIAKNYRGFTATGQLLEIRDGLWGYGGDSVALVLDVNDDWGQPHWPAGLCKVADSEARNSPAS